MISIQDIRTKPQGMLVIGNHPAIMQAILDFDFASGRPPSIVACITGNRKAQKFFFGTEEILIPCFPGVHALPPELRSRIQWALNMQSGRRTYESLDAFFAAFPRAHGAHIFAENVPENHATRLIAKHGDKLIAGPSGVGLLVPGALKLGAIGGTGIAQLVDGHLATRGSIAVVSTSGGMTNELITSVAHAGKRLSFAMSIGGDRFPVTSLGAVLSLAEKDPDTEAIVYFGELGGVDEYEIVAMREKGELTKPVIAYVAGVIDEAFDEHMQFGHAKALVARKDESARAKREALRSSGAIAPDTFPAFLEALRGVSTRPFSDPAFDASLFEKRRASILSTRRMFHGEVAEFVRGKKLVAKEGAFTRAALPDHGRIRRRHLLDADRSRRARLRCRQHDDHRARGEGSRRIARVRPPHYRAAFRRRRECGRRAVALGCRRGQRGCAIRLRAYEGGLAPIGHRPQEISCGYSGSARRSARTIREPPEEASAL